MNLEPVANKVVVRPDRTEEVTRGGIIIPDVAKEQQQTAANRGEIIAIGPDADLHYSIDGVKKLEMEVGDRVIFARYGGSIVRADTKDGRQEYRILYDADIICRISGTEEPEMVNPRRSMVT